MYSYNYSIVNDLKGYLNIDQLFNNVEAQINSIQSVKTNNDTAIILFSAQLATADETLLNTIVQNYTPEYIGSKQEVIKLEKKCSLGIYNVVSNFTFRGMNALTNITHIKVLSNINSGNFALKLYDYSHNTIIGSNTFNNNKPRSCDLGTLSNMTENIAAWELHCKVATVGTVVNLYSLIVYYD